METNAKEIFRVSSAESSSCALCSESIDGPTWFTRAVNHYIQDHGCKLVHVGQESTGYVEDKYETTVAILAL